MAQYLPARAGLQWVGGGLRYPAARVKRSGLENWLSRQPRSQIVDSDGMNRRCAVVRTQDGGDMPKDLACEIEVLQRPRVTLRD